MEEVGIYHSPAGDWPGVWKMWARCPQVSWHSPTSWGAGLAGAQNFVTDFLLPPTRLPQCTYCLLLGPLPIKLHKVLSWGSRIDRLSYFPSIIFVFVKPFLPRIILPKGQASWDHFSQLPSGHGHGHSKPLILVLLCVLIPIPSFLRFLVRTWMNLLSKSRYSNRY